MALSVLSPVSKDPWHTPTYIVMFFFKLTLLFKTTIHIIHQKQTKVNITALQNICIIAWFFVDNFEAKSLKTIDFFIFVEYNIREV